MRGKNKYKKERERESEIAKAKKQFKCLNTHWHKTQIRMKPHEYQIINML